MVTGKILDLGCGKNKYVEDSYEIIGTDSTKLPDVDVVHDLEKTPLPFGDSEFDGVYASHVLEHITNFFPLMEDIHRITRNGGKVIIKVPFYASWGMFNDPTHVRFFTPMTMTYFDDRNPWRYQLKIKAKYRLERTRVNYGVGKSKILNWFFNPIINFSGFTMAAYCRFFAWIFPASEIIFEMRVIK